MIYDPRVGSAPPRTGRPYGAMAAGPTATRYALRRRLHILMQLSCDINVHMSSHVHTCNNV